MLWRLSATTTPNICSKSVTLALLFLRFDQTSTVIEITLYINKTKSAVFFVKIKFIKNETCSQIIISELSHVCFLLDVFFSSWFPVCTLLHTMLCVFYFVCLCAGPWMRVAVHQYSWLLEPLPLIDASPLMVKSLTLFRPEAVCGCDCLCARFSIQECLWAYLKYLFVCVCVSSGCCKYWSASGQWARLTTLQYSSLAHAWSISAAATLVVLLVWRARPPRLTFATLPGYRSAGPD